MIVEGKRKFYKQGYTKDIIKACLLQWQKSWLQCDNFAVKHQGIDIAETCENIFWHLVKNVSYKEDPIGKQFIKTPGRLLTDGIGDCKSFSILTASSLQCLGIDVVLRFVMYPDDVDYSHVYPVALDESGNEIPIDAVAYIQRKTPFGKELKFIKKLDMRSTEISFLSGVGSGYPTSSPDNHDNYSVEQGEIYGDLDLPQEIERISEIILPAPEKLRSNNRLHQNYLAALINLLEIRSIAGENLFLQIQLFRHLKAATKADYTASDLQTIAYVFAGHLENGKYAEGDEKHFEDLLAEILSEIDGFLSGSSEYTVSPELESRQADFLGWFSQNIISRNFVKSGDSIEAFLDFLAPISLYFFYTAIEHSQLNEVQREKKSGALEQLTELIEDVAGIDMPTAILYINAEVVRQTGLNLDVIMSKFTTNAVGNLLNDIGGLIREATQGAASIINASRGNRNNNAPSQSDFRTPVFSSQNNNMLLIGGGVLVAGLAFYALKKKK